MVLKKIRAVAKIFSLAIVILPVYLYGECKVDYSILYTIAAQERHIDKPIGYPYLISFNSAKSAIKSKRKLKLNWLDKRTIDCSNLQNCKNKLSEINNLGIYNLDLGAFQHNQLVFNYKDKDKYFILKENLSMTNKILCDIYKEHYKWNWNTIAKYHSRTPSVNKQYAEHLKILYVKITQGQYK